MAVSTDVGAIEVIDRRRVVVIDPGMAGASQPYHLAEKLELSEAEKYLANHGAASERLSIAAVRDVVEELQRRECRVAGSGILLASGRPLPPLPQIFASHALIHTAEGELFRNIFRRACERLEIRVAGFRERDLNEHANAAFGSAATRMQRRIAIMGRSLGPPWTSDHKTAALAASMVLAGKTTGTRPKAVLKSASRLKRS